jgi:hypothetical protein
LKKLRILISGDSFAVDDPNLENSWPNLLKHYHNVVNVAQAGVGEYKILKQLEKITLTDYDVIIVVHTSPYRVHINQHPLHSTSALHKNCDLIFNDIEKSNSQNIVTETAVNYFKYIFDKKYYEDIYSLIKKEIYFVTHSCKTLHLTFFDKSDEKTDDLSAIWKKFPGNINHLNVKGNQQVLEKILKWIDQNY